MRNPGAHEALAPLERALLEHQKGARGRTLRVRMDDGRVQSMPVGLFFRDARSLRGADRAALAHARGRVLDVGAGGGALALALERAGHAVTALELLPGAARVLRARGLADVRTGDVRTFRPRGGYDTVIALMNGTAPAGTLAGLASWLAALAAPLAPAGRLLVDSTDLRVPGSRPVRSDGRYVGELQYQLEDRGERGPPFPQLFVDPLRLGRAAPAAQLRARIVWKGPGGTYLAALTRVADPPR